MENRTITFNTNGYDGFIDFIKVYAILCVLLGHTCGFLLDKVAYGVWAGMQVPLFILVQTFHSYKTSNVRVNIGKVLKRVVLPFACVEMITFIMALCIRGTDNVKMLIDGFFRDGGFGPGSYYPWVYLQVALLLPVFGLLLKRCNKYVSMIVFLLICEGFEILFSFMGVPDNIYRLLAVRYIFLFYLGWIWVKEGIRINMVNILLSIAGLVAIIYFEYYSVNDEPWFFNTGWNYHRWPCYFFVSYGLTPVLFLLWKLVCRNDFVVRCVKTIASASYEIFLVQMSLIFLFQANCLSSLISSNVLRKVIWIFMIWTISILGGIIFHSWRKKQKNVEVK